MFELFTRNSYTFPLEYLKKSENVCSFAFSIALYIVLICTSRYASYVSRILMINPSHNTIHVMFVITFHFVYVYCFPIIHLQLIVELNSEYRIWSVTLDAQTNSTENTSEFVIG